MALWSPLWVPIIIGRPTTVPAIDSAGESLETRVPLMYRTVGFAVQHITDQCAAAPNVRAVMMHGHLEKA